MSDTPPQHSNDPDHRDSSSVDRHLMRRVAAGDEAAFASFLDRHRSIALGIASRFGVDSEEVLQEASISAWRSRGTFDADRGTAQSWFLTIVRNRAIDLHRKHSRRVSQTEREEDLDRRTDGSASPEERAILAERATSLDCAVEALPTSQQQVIRLGYVDGLSHSEIAERVGVPLGTIKGRSRLGLQRLRDSRAALSDFAFSEQPALAAPTPV